MKVVDLVRIALAKRVFAPPAPMTREFGEQRYASPERRAWKALKRRVDARQARRMAKRSYALRDAARTE